MTLGFNTTLRNDRQDLITADIDKGAGAGKLRIYDGSRPATGGTATTLLAELTFSDPSFAAASAGAITANSITGDTSADATGTATWFRIVDSNDVFVMDGSVGTSGADLNFNTVAFSAGVAVDVSSMVFTHGDV